MTKRRYTAIWLICSVVILMITILGDLPLFSSNTLEWPLEINKGLTSSFGEFRFSHFHAGIDLKTDGQTGLKVFAADSGLIYRLNVRKRGYGKALYIRHANDLITVYGHLERFEEQILHLESIVSEHAMTKGKYPGNIFLSIPVKKGQLIGYSGETGAGLPHLHFEVRKGEDKPVNPLYYGLAVADSSTPVFRNLRFRPVSVWSLIDYAPDEQSFSIARLRKMTSSQCPIVSGRIEIMADAYDTIGSYNKVGLHSLTLMLNDHVINKMTFDKMTYSNNHRIGLLYQLVQSGFSPTRYLYRCKHYSSSHVPFDTYMNTNESVLDTRKYPDGISTITLVGDDFNGNSTTLSFPLRIHNNFSSARITTSVPNRLHSPSMVEHSVIEYDNFICIRGNVNSQERFPLVRATDPTGANVVDIPLYELTTNNYLGMIDLNPYKSGMLSVDFFDSLKPYTILQHKQLEIRHFKPGKKYVYREKDFTLTIPVKALYEDLFLKYGRSEAEKCGNLKPLGKTVSFFPAGTPFDEAAQLQFTYPNDPIVDRKKIGIYKFYDNGQYWSYQFPSVTSPNLVISINYLSQYGLFLDVIAPRITPHSTFKANQIKRGDIMLLIVRDEGMGINDHTISAVLAQETLETEYDPDRHWIKVFIPLGMETGQKKLTVSVSDYGGNRSKEFIKVLTIKG